VETARRFLGMLGRPPRVDAELATVEEAATVQRLLSAAMASEDEGRRVLLD
jgi:predicted dehydrogenase